MRAVACIAIGIRLLADAFDIRIVCIIVWIVDGRLGVAQSVERAYVVYYELCSSVLPDSSVDLAIVFNPRALEAVQQDGHLL